MSGTVVQISILLLISLSSTSGYRSGILGQIAEFLKIPLDTPFGELNCNLNITSWNGYIYSHEAKIATALLNVSGVSGVLGSIAGTEDLVAYPSGIDCYIIMKYDEGWRFLLQFPSAVHLVGSDYLAISTGNNVLLNITAENSGQQEPIEVQNNEVRFQFHTSANSEGGEGFHIQYSVFFPAVPIDGCVLENGETNFRCDENRCVPRSFQCDGVEQCLDESDENEETALCTIFDTLVGHIRRLGIYSVLIAALIVLLILTVVCACFIVKCKKSRAARGRINTQ